MPPLWALADSEPFVIQNSAPKLAITINPTTPNLIKIFCNFTENFQRQGGSSCCTARSIFPVNLFTTRKYLLDKLHLLKSPPDLPVGNGVDWRVGDLPLSSSFPHNRQHLLFQDALSCPATSLGYLPSTPQKDYHSIFLLKPTSFLQEPSHKSYQEDIFSILLWTVQICFSCVVGYGYTFTH